MFVTQTDAFKFDYKFTICFFNYGTETPTITEFSSKHADGRYPQKNINYFLQPIVLEEKVFSEVKC